MRDIEIVATIRQWETLICLFLKRTMRETLKGMIGQTVRPCLFFCLKVSGHGL